MHKMLVNHKGTSFIKCIALIICCGKNHARITLAVNRTQTFFCCTVNNFILAWMIYGNTFMYSDAAINCKNSNHQARMLWRLSVAMLVSGYLLFLFYILFIS